MKGTEKTVQHTAAKPLVCATPSLTGQGWAGLQTQNPVRALAQRLEVCVGGFMQKQAIHTRTGGKPTGYPSGKVAGNREGEQGIWLRTESFFSGISGAGRGLLRASCKAQRARQSRLA